MRQQPNDLDTLAFQAGLPAAIGRFSPAPRSARAARTRHRPLRSFLRAVTAVCLTVVALGLSVGSASGQASGATPEVGYPALDGLVQVTAGGQHSCAVTASHQARCWGPNDQGQLGIGGIPEAFRAVTVLAVSGNGPLTGVTAMTTGDSHSCAIVTGGEVRCWGYNGKGQLGDGTTSRRVLPVPVLATSGNGHLRGVTQLSAMENTTCARLANGEARCWGAGQDGELGNGQLSDRSRPTPVRAVSGSGRLTGVTQIEVGERHVCARLANGQARCWGANSEGQLGNGTVVGHARPVVVRNTGDTGPLTGVGQVSAGTAQSCATRVDQTAVCWGSNGQGQLGTGTFDDRHLPTVVVADAARSPLRGVAGVGTGFLHSCARLTNGQVRCWGQNGFDQLGNGVEAGPKSAVAGPVRNRTNSGDLVGVAQVSVGSSHTCVRLTNEEARCWGYDGTGALGDGGTTPSPVPVVVTLSVN